MAAGVIEGEAETLTYAGSVEDHEQKEHCHIRYHHSRQRNSR